MKESTYQEGRLAADLGNLVGAMLGRLRPSLRFGGGETDPVRRLYFEMLAAAARRGVERRPPETPLEVSPRLERAFAAPAPMEITDLFDEVRYGGRRPDPERVARLREEWEQLESEG